ncbi:MAG: hypothetical protein KAR16_01370 [Bacteroidales bacterium]|nr:hypothetical protein [Bacteroidales bacterium]
MKKPITNAVEEEKAALLYGMQRTGSNFTQQVLLQNFQNIRFCYNHHFRCLPTHKHFRLYDEKSLIPDVRYLNSFTYKGFRDFKKHVEQIAGREIGVFIVTIKDPYCWYVSYKKHAKKNKYIYLKKSLNSHYIFDYNLFYRKWFDFSLEAPGEVIMVKYEDLIGDLNLSLNRIGDKFNLERSSEVIIQPEKVLMSKKFTAVRAAFYKEKNYLDLISDQEKSVIQHLLDKELLSAFNYQIIR